MQPKPSSLRAQAHQSKSRTETEKGETLEKKLLDIRTERLEQRERRTREETATHIGIREAEDWFRPIDLAKECDIYISSRSGSRKEILLLMDIPKTPLK
ncbi:hypothetical protein TNCV_4885911 [Trichonephila clavipes]|uniref:Uncharacterized protein n=1 Tax=Trichonephila clavipes TaxID=2585209 RepID=A0A8X6RK60_TRICX|nr:hypothetical protein TNCV_4885911 [Trichonephila clavipes]